MMKHTTPDPCPCPFCRSTSIAVVGVARAFLHYRCASCEEVWTAMNAPAVPAGPRAHAMPVGHTRAEKPTVH